MHYVFAGRDVGRYTGRKSIDSTSSYLASAVKDNENTVINTTHRLRVMTFAFDTLVCRGLSGSLVVPQVARALNLNFLIVRKEELHHGINEFAEGQLGKHWLFVDDFISSGATLEATGEAVSKVVDGYPGFVTEYMGYYAYITNRFRWRDEFPRQFISEKPEVSPNPGPMAFKYTDLG